LGAGILLLGVAAMALGVWTAVMRRRPSWLRPLPANTARSWGAATAVGGLGVAVWAANMLFVGSLVLELVGVVLLLSGAIWVSVASPRVRRPRRPQ
jgi:hypothetical protein